MNEHGQLVLYLVVCGAKPAGSGVPELVIGCQEVGWDVCVVPTRLGRRFLDTGRLAKLTGHPLRDDYKHPHEEDVLPPADAIVVAPATFNTVNKLAAAISDTLWLGLVNDAIGAGVPVTMAVHTSDTLAAHPAFGPNVATLRSYGIRFVPDTEDLLELTTRPPDAPFPWDALLRSLTTLHTTLTPHP